MIVQFNTDHNIHKSEEYSNSVIALISKDLHRFTSQITRIELHLTDQNGNKEGINDKRCVLEARLEGLQPIAVTNDADTNDTAIKGALDKLKAVLDTKLGRLANH